MVTVIGFMGESGHGKDFCGTYLVEKAGFVTMGFADVLKRFCRRVFGFSQKGLWGDYNFRNEYVIPFEYEEEDTAKAWERAYKAFVTLSRVFAHEVGSVVGWDRKTCEKYTEVLLDWWRECAKIGLMNDQKISPRIVLQLLGTEFGRHFQEDIWVDYLYKGPINDLRNGHRYDRTMGRFYGGIYEEPPTGVLITDHRFNNEVIGSQKRGGYVIKIVRISREGKPNPAEEGGIKGHASEAEQRGLPDEMFDLVLRMKDGPENVYPRLDQMVRDREWEQKRKHAAGI